MFHGYITRSLGLHAGFRRRHRDDNPLPNPAPRTPPRRRRPPPPHSLHLPFHQHISTSPAALPPAASARRRWRRLTGNAPTETHYTSLATCFLPTQIATSWLPQVAGDAGKRTAPPPPLLGAAVLGFARTNFLPLGNLQFSHNLNTSTACLRRPTLVYRREDMPRFIHFSTAAANSSVPTPSTDITCLDWLEPPSRETELSMVEKWRRSAGAGWRGTQLG